MAPFARLITVTFEKSLRDYGPKAVWTGNPANRLSVEELNSAKIYEKYNLNLHQPLVLVTGGGTGSVAINELIVKNKQELSAFVQIVHLTGRGKTISGNENTAHYQSFEILPSDEVFQLMNVAALVISRCGLATLTELCTLAKPAILIPMPDSHQEDNAAVFEKAKAALVLNQKNISDGDLVKNIRDILENNDLRKQLSSNISKIMKQDATSTIVGLIWEILAPQE
jgi:UDP-N-acetylglucosamine--N-acetylmuramyl-(pentapeptide) pyrophosphoryl-undecaprenol N-acetylglucosamine transferase